MKYVVVGDLHLSEHLGYYHIIKDGRESEKREVLDFIVQTFVDNNCDGVIFLGDQFDKKNNPSVVVKEFTKFIERFVDKDVYIIAGNHEKSPSKETALDYLKEINGKDWYIITDLPQTINGMLFCPYFYKAELNTDDDNKATEKILNMLYIRSRASEEKKLSLFTHFAISDSLTSSGQNVNLFNEIVLPRGQMEEQFSKIFGGHIHQPEVGEKTVVAGSIFNQEVGETGKNIYIYDNATNDTKVIPLPGRGIYKLENPTEEDVEKIGEHNIVKVYITDRKIDIEEMKVLLKKFDGYVIVEQYPNERRKVTYGDEIMDLSIENLLTMYSDQKKIDKKVIMSAWNKIK